jgi:hypothetical protein
MMMGKYRRITCLKELGNPLGLVIKMPRCCPKNLQISFFGEPRAETSAMKQGGLPGTFREEQVRRYSGHAFDVATVIGVGVRNGVEV